MKTLESEISVEAISPASARPRLDFIDNLRWVMIVLVVSMHAAVTYSHIGSWYFMENPKPDLATTVAFATYQIFLQAFFMGLLFLIAGYFVPAAFDRKGFGRFLRDRAVRLGIPSLFFMLFIQPITVYWLLRSFADPTRQTLTQAYLPYIYSGDFLSGSGPMWFAVALLFFSCVYAIARQVSGTPTARLMDTALPTNLQVIGLIVVMGLSTFLVRVVQPMGTSILNMQFCFFSQYVLLFWVGLCAARRDWLLRIPYTFGRRWLVLALSLGSLIWVALISSIVKTHTEGKLSGGWTWQSAILSFWESFFCVGVCLGLIVVFRDKLNHQGKATRWLSDNSFSVYLFHTPLLIAVTLLLRNVSAPKPLKFIYATIAGVTFSYLASSWLFRRIPGLRRVL